MSKMRKLRDEAGLSQQGLANLSGVSRSMVSAIECGEKTPSLKLMKMLSVGLDVSMTRVLNAVMSEAV